MKKVLAIVFSISSALRSFFSRMTMTMTSRVIMTAATTTTTASTPARAAVADDDELDDVVSLVSAHGVRENKVRVTCYTNHHQWMW